MKIGHRSFVKREGKNYFVVDQEIRLAFKTRPTLGDISRFCIARGCWNKIHTSGLCRRHYEMIYKENENGKG